MNFSILVKFCTCEKFRNHKIAKLIHTKCNTCQVWDYLFPNIWSKYDINTHMSYISAYSHETRVSVTYLITITSINNRKIDIQWDICFLFLLKITKLNTCEIFCNHPNEIYFLFPCLCICHQINVLNIHKKICLFCFSYSNLLLVCLLQS